jgi:hypothetical protein
MPKTPDDVIQETVNVYHATGYNQRETARQLGVARFVVQKRIKMAEECGIKPRVRVSGGKVAAEAAPRIAKVVWFTDAHNQPGMNTERFEWLAKLVNDTKPDYLIDGGDFDDLNSLCSYERNDSWSGKFKPTFLADLAASKEARDMLDTLVTHECEKHFIMGNHEDRLYQFENINPELYGMMQHAYEEIHAQWAITPYRGYLDIEGVDFTHVPMNGMNKPLGGDKCAVHVAVKSIRDCCFGHTHTYGYWEESKLGPNRSTTAICGGSFMPDKYVPKYAKGSSKGYWYGCHIVEISEGRIIGHTPITMRELKARYS